MTTNKNRITIEIRDGIDPSDALRRVAHVVQNGRVSNNGLSYCYGTIWADGVQVHTRQYRKTDCFVVLKRKT
jgi:hypothetical protein